LINQVSSTLRQDIVLALPYLRTLAQHPALPILDRYKPALKRIVDAMNEAGCPDSTSVNDWCEKQLRRL